MGYSVTFDTTQFEKELKRLETSLAKMDNHIEDFCRDVVASAKLRVPVDTGKLKWSIRYTKQGKGRFEISADAPYAGHVEYGTRRMRAQPYLRPAVNAHRQKLINRIKQELDG